MIGKGNTKELKPNSKEPVKVGDLRVYVSHVYDPQLKTRMWEWRGVNYGDFLGFESEFIYGNYDEKINVVEEHVRSNKDENDKVRHCFVPSASTRTYDEEEEDDLDETGINTIDIDLLMTHLGVSRRVAVKALKTPNGLMMFEDLLKNTKPPQDTLLPSPTNLSGEIVYYYPLIFEEEERSKPYYKDIENLKKNIIDMIGKGKTKELKPNSKELVKVGDHLIYVSSTYQPELETRMWEWCGNIIVDYGLNTGRQYYYVRGNYEEKLNVEEFVGSTDDEDVYYEVNVGEPFGSTNDDDVYYEVNYEEPVGSSK